MTWAWISAAPSKMLRMRASHEHAADGELLRVAVAAMDLQRDVGVGPGRARGEQLGHPGLDVAAPPVVLLARGEIGQLARHHRVRPSISASLSATRGNRRSAGRIAAIASICKASSSAALRNADPARGSLDARAFEGRHQLLEAQPSHAAQEALGRHGEAVEDDLVFLHAAIAQNRDLAARSCPGSGRGRPRPPRCFGARNMQSPRIARGPWARCAPAQSSDPRARHG